MSVDVKYLSDKQRYLVEKNHNLIYSFASKNKISLDEFYGALAEGLCKAAMHYDNNRSAFSTFAFSCMRNEFLSELRKLQNKSHIPIDKMHHYDEKYECYYEKGIPEEFIDFSCYDDVLCGMVLDALRAKLNKKENEIVSMRLDGLSRNDIAEKFGCSNQNVAHYINKIKNKTAYLFKIQ